MGYFKNIKKCYHLRDLQRICKFLTVDSAVLLVNAMVSSQLGYCNTLLYGVDKGSVAKRQKFKMHSAILCSCWTK